MKIALTPGNPERVVSGSGFYHVTLDPNGWVPVRVAVEKDTLTAGGGDYLYPGYALDIWSDEAIWIQQPSSGKADVHVEVRKKSSRVSVDPVTATRSQVSHKAGFWEVTPGSWQGPIVSNVVGMVGLYLRARGGDVWIGTHVDRSDRPDQKSLTAGDGFLVRDGDPPLWLEGNPAGLYVWTDQHRVMVYILKVARGWSW